ncbi:pyridoxal-phosphate dependent enzyme [Luteimonas salinilitoris]|uniref:Pyridoxal-phosphate dependent enzyme n=1 Tax=Luteimonas salinilitoris TaxID=3237697 RepID=A0ABV4HRP4_9GAMM
MHRSLHSPPSADPADWTEYRRTRLVELPGLARLAGVGRVFVKAEWERNLGNFKSLGGMLAGLRALARAAGARSIRALLAAGASGARLPRLVCASDGNHGLAVAAAAARAGAGSRIYLPESVAGTRADRIEVLGGEVIRVSGTYDDAVSAAVAAAFSGDGLLVPDTSADVHDQVVGDVMAGYAVMTGEIAAQLREHAGARPTHLFVQAGVGGLAAAMAEGLHGVMRAPNRLLVVEPESADCVSRALSAGAPVRIAGDLHTCADMLSCGLASAPALEVLLRHAAESVLVGEERLRDAVDVLRDTGGVETTPSGAAGLAGLLDVAPHPVLRDRHRLDADSHVLLVVTEGAIVTSRVGPAG